MQSKEDVLLNFNETKIKLNFESMDVLISVVRSIQSVGVHWTTQFFPQIATW